MSSSIVVWPIIKALLAAGHFVGVNPSAWLAVNNTQQFFLSNHFAHQNEITRFSNTELRAWASQDYQELNSILKREGFTIQLDPFTTPNAFGVVSILDVQVEWPQSGTKTEISAEHNGKQNSFPAVAMDEHFAIYSTQSSVQPLVCLNTKNGDTVWMTIAEHTTPLKDFELLQWIQSVKENRRWHARRCNSVTFPMVDLNQ